MEFPAIDMVFHKNGNFEFNGGFEWMSPGTWQYDFNKKEILIRLPKARTEDMKLQEYLKNLSKPAEYNNPKAVSINEKTILYDFPGRINFGKFIFDPVK